jgi:beta-lactam-binding protein with PASTA domain
MSSKFKVYQFDFKGLWLGGEIHVVAESQERAEIEAKAHVKESGYKPETVELKETEEIREGKVIYFYDGDY